MASLVRGALAAIHDALSKGEERENGTGNHPAARAIHNVGAGGLVGSCFHVDRRAMFQLLCAKHLLFHPKTLSARLSETEGALFDYQAPSPRHGEWKS